MITVFFIQRACTCLSIYGTVLYLRPVQYAVSSAGTGQHTDTMYSTYSTVLHRSVARTSNATGSTLTNLRLESAPACLRVAHSLIDHPRGCQRCQRCQGYQGYQPNRFKGMSIPHCLIHGCPIRIPVRRNCTFWIQGPGSSLPTQQYFGHSLFLPAETDENRDKVFLCHIQTTSTILRNLHLYDFGRSATTTYPRSDVSFPVFPAAGPCQSTASKQPTSRTAATVSNFQPGTTL